MKWSTKDWKATPPHKIRLEVAKSWGIKAPFDTLENMGGHLQQQAKHLLLESGHMQSQHATKTCDLDGGA